MAMEAFDLAERFQCLVFVMSNLDLAMNTWMSHTVHVSGAANESWQGARRRDARPHRRVAPLQGRRRRRHCNRTIPGSGMPAYFTRGSGHNEKGQYSEQPDETTSTTWIVCSGSSRPRGSTCRGQRSCPRPAVEVGIIGYGTSHWAIDESREQLEREFSLRTGYLRLRGYPFNTELDEFIDRYQRIYVVEQNRDAQMLGLMRLDCVPGRVARLRSSVLHYSGLPIDARSVTDSIEEQEGLKRPRHADALVFFFFFFFFFLYFLARMTHKLANSGNPAQRRSTASALKWPPYRGGKTTLCAGCGHNAISERIIDAFFEMGVDPRGVIKLSGHGLLEQEPGVFPRLRPRLQHHARLDAVGRHRRGARQPQADCNRRQRRRRYWRDRHRPVRAPDAPQRAADLHHRRQRLLRSHERAVLADRRHRLDDPRRHADELPPIDTCSLAIDLGASFVARSFSVTEQLLTILKAALSHRGTCMIDVLSPCVTFNDIARAGARATPTSRSTKRRSASGVRRTPSPASKTINHDRIRAGYDDRGEAARRFEPAAEEGERGLQPDRQARGAAAAAGERPARPASPPVSSTSRPTSRISLESAAGQCGTLNKPLATLDASRVRPPRSALDEFMEAHR